MNLSIKKLSEKDLPLAKQLLEWFQADDGIEHPVIPTDEYLNNLLSTDTFHMLAAMHNALFIGGLTAFEIPTYYRQGVEMFLYEIGVHGPYRQLGVATQLIETLKEICSVKAIPVIYVGTEMDNVPAKKLYTATGGELEEVAWFTYQLNNKNKT